MGYYVIGDLPNLEIYKAVFCLSKFLLTQDHMQLKIQTPLLRFSFNLKQTLWRHWLPWWNIIL